MRSFGLILLSTLMILIVTANTTAQAQMDEEGSGGDDPGDIFAKDDESAKPTKKPASSSSEMVMDEESVSRKSDSSGRLVDADFLSLGGTAAWLDRNGLGLHLGLGGYTCMREYCNTTLDVSILGSIAGTLGVYYRVNPNWSFFADATIAHLNTNIRLGGTASPGDNKGFVFQFVIGPAFHLPVKGWLDIYTNLGFGPIMLRAKTDNDPQHHWGGIDIEWGLGANFYFWSVGALKNFSLGPYMKMGFSIWPKVCEVIDGIEDCQKPSDMETRPTNENLFWSDSPFTFQLGIEARYEFSMGGKEEAPVAQEPKKDPKKDAPADKDNDGDAQSDEDAINSSTDGNSTAGEAEASGSAGFSM